MKPPIDFLYELRIECLYEGGGRRVSSRRERWERREEREEGSGSPSPPSPALLLCRPPLGLLLINHASNVGQKFLGVVDDAVFDRVQYTPDTFDFTGFVVQPWRAVAI
jgi:hypothetical protein